MLFVVVFCLGAIALTVRRNRVPQTGASDVGVLLDNPRSRLQPFEGDNMLHPRSFGAASKDDRLGGGSGATSVQDKSARLDVATRSAAPLEAVKPMVGFTVDGTPVRAEEQQRARGGGGATPQGQLPRFNLDGEAAAESPRPALSSTGKGKSIGAVPMPRFGVNGEEADEAKPRAGTNSREDADAGKTRFGINGEEAGAAKEQAPVAERAHTTPDRDRHTDRPRFGVNGELPADEPHASLANPVAEARTDRSRKAPALDREAASQKPAASSELPLRHNDAFGLDSEEPTVVAPARTKASGILTATKALPVETLSPEEDPEPPHLLGEIHEKMSLRTDERMSRFDELMAANDPRAEGRSSDAQQQSSDLGARGSATADVDVDPAVVWKPRDATPAAVTGRATPLAEEEQPRAGLRAEEVKDTDQFPFLDAADLLHGHPRRSEIDQKAGYKGKTIGMRLLK